MGSVLSGEDIAKGRDWKVSSISTMVPTKPVVIEMGVHGVCSLYCRQCKLRGQPTKDMKKACGEETT